MINLEKTEGKKINLTKAAPAMQNIKAVLWWNAPEAFDLDVSAFILKNTADGPKLVGEDYFIFYNNRTSPCGSVTLSEDKRSGGTEELQINLSGMTIPNDEISFVVTIDKGAERGQSFGQITEAGIKIINADTGEDLAFYDLDAQGGQATAVQVGSLYKENNEFHFQAVGAFYNVTLSDFVGGYL